MIHIDVNVAAPGLAETVSAGRDADRHGAAHVGVWDSPAAIADPWTALGALSQHVRRSRIGVAVTNPVTRHPVVTARAAATLAGAAPAGCFLGIGSGDSGVRNLGESPSTADVLRDYVRCIRELLHEGHSNWRGKPVFLTHGEAPPAVPVYVAAHGLRALEVAAETADGALIGLGISADVVEQVFETLHRARERAGRDPDRFDVRWVVPGVAVDLDPEVATTQVGWLMASFAHHLTRTRAAASLVPPSRLDAIRTLGAEYDLSRHGRQPPELRARYITRARELGVWDYLSDRLLVAGTPDQVVDRLQGLTRLGVRSLQITTAVSGTEAVRTVLGLASSVS